MKLLIDEMLSPTLVGRLGDELGIAPQHVVHVGMAGAPDFDVWASAFAHDQVVVTLNYGDFLDLAAGSAVHPGLIVIREGGLSREEQWGLLRPVVESLGAEDLVNKVVEIYAHDRFVIRGLPVP